MAVTGVDTFTEALRVFVYCVFGLGLVAAIIATIEMVATEIRHYRRRPWWRADDDA
jgi:hypothetical protein